MPKARSVLECVSPRFALDTTYALKEYLFQEVKMTFNLYHDILDNIDCTLKMEQKFVVWLNRYILDYPSINICGIFPS